MITQLLYRTKHNKKNKQPICCIKSEEKRVITIYNLLLLTGSQSFSATTYEYRRSQEYIPWRSISTTQKIKRENTTPKQTKCLLIHMRKTFPQADSENTFSKISCSFGAFLRNIGSSRKDGTPICHLLASYISFHACTISSILNPIPSSALSLEQ